MKNFIKYLFGYKKNKYRLEYPIKLDANSGIICGDRYFRVEVFTTQVKINNPSDVKAAKLELLQNTVNEISNKIKSSINIETIGKERPILEIRYPICIEGM